MILRVAICPFRQFNKVRDLDDPYIVFELLLNVSSLEIACRVKYAALRNEFPIQPQDRTFASRRTTQSVFVKLTARRNYNFFLSTHAAKAEINAVGKNIEATCTTSASRISSRELIAARIGNISDRVLTY